LAKGYFFKDLYANQDRDAALIKSTYELIKTKFKDNGAEIIKNE
jgi:hypothetical protein